MVTKEEFIQLSQQTKQDIKDKLAEELNSEVLGKDMVAEDLIASLLAKTMKFSIEYTNELLLKALYPEKEQK